MSAASGESWLGVEAAGGLEGVEDGAAERRGGERRSMVGGAEGAVLKTERLSEGSSRAASRKAPGY
jgi:hypothetical protein